MMTTVNLSLSKDQLGLIDSLTASYGFTNRSEFIRSLLRLLRIKPEIMGEAAIFPFVAPKEKSAKKIMASFTKTNKYSKEFLKDLKEGLKSSEYFTPHSSYDTMAKEAIAEHNRGETTVLKTKKDVKKLISEVKK